MVMRLKPAAKKKKKKVAIMTFQIKKDYHRSIRICPNVDRKLNIYPNKTITDNGKKRFGDNRT